MCGIVGYIGKQKATPILIEGLKRLEYRGYDLAGIAHTRWATYGKPSDRNSHPHSDCHGNIFWRITASWKIIGNLRII